MRIAAARLSARAMVLRPLGIAVTARYIASGANPADCISRGEPVDWEKLSVAVEEVERLGGSACRAFPKSTTKSHERLSCTCVTMGG